MVGVSGVAAAFAGRWSGMDATCLVPNLLDVEQVQRMVATSADRPRHDVVFVGRLVARKGCEELLSSLDLVRRTRQGRPLRVAIVGDGPMRSRLERRARRLGLDASVAFHGAVDDQRKFALLSGARVACFPSLFGESFGVVVLEALAAGAEMVLAGDNPGYRELLRDPRGLEDPRRPEVFGARLQALIEADDLRVEIGRRQRRLLVDCDADVVTDRIVEIYRSALRRRRDERVVGGPLRVAA
jgi:phosphatidylinositol alpha-mannosyltransferase